MARVIHIHKRIALCLTVVYFALSGTVVLEVGEHALKHRQHTNHAAQHASFICTWMCAASSSVVSSGDEAPTRGFGLAPEKPRTYESQLFARLLKTPISIRPPPVS